MLSLLHLDAFVASLRCSRCLIDITDFQNLVETNCIPFDKFSNKNENDLEPIQQGGIYILLKEYGTLVGEIINENYLEYYGYNNIFLKKYSKILMGYKDCSISTLINEEQSLEKHSYDDENNKKISYEQNDEIDQDNSSIR